MIVWINGAFGAGKTTTAALVQERIPGARIFDPEYVGYLLTTFVPAPTGDFQDLPLWRRLTIQAVKGLDDEYAGTWVAPMSLIRADYRIEILGALRLLGVDVREFVLTVPEATLRARIDADEIDTKARQWRQDHAAQALATFEGLTDAVFVDATVPAGQVADTIVAAVRAHPSGGGRQRAGRSEAGHTYGRSSGMSPNSGW
jgi:predicted kinase